MWWAQSIPLVGIGLTLLPNYGQDKAHLAHPLTASMLCGGHDLLYSLGWIRVMLADWSKSQLPPMFRRACNSIGILVDDTISFQSKGKISTATYNQ